MLYIIRIQSRITFVHKSAGRNKSYSWLQLMEVGTTLKVTSCTSRKLYCGSTRSSAWIGLHQPHYVKLQCPLRSFFNSHPAKTPLTVTICSSLKSKKILTRRIPLYRPAARVADFNHGGKVYIEWSL